MRNRRRESRGKKINPHFWVFCEGETEEVYVRFLRSEYRIPVEIIPKIAGSNINERYINSYKKGKPTHEKDKDFLVYDADISDILDKLRKVNSSTLIASNPSIELWFLLHYKNQTSSISEDDCCRQLSNRNRNKYKKGIMSNLLKAKLREKSVDACNRSKLLELYKNPSTNFHVFIEALEEIKNEKL